MYRPQTVVASPPEISYQLSWKVEPTGIFYETKKEAEEALCRWAFDELRSIMNLHGFAAIKLAIENKDSMGSNWSRALKILNDYTTREKESTT